MGTGVNRVSEVTGGRFDYAKAAGVRWVTFVVSRLWDRGQPIKLIAGLAIKLRVDPSPVVAAVLADGINDRLTVDECHQERLTGIRIERHSRHASGFRHHGSGWPAVWFL